MALNWRIWSRQMRRYATFYVQPRPPYQRWASQMLEQATAARGVHRLRHATHSRGGSSPEICMLFRKERVCGGSPRCCVPSGAGHHRGKASGGPYSPALSPSAKREKTACKSKLMCGTMSAIRKKGPQCLAMKWELHRFMVSGILDQRS